MRIPIAVNLGSRDGSVAKDAKGTNCIVENAGEDKKVRKRPGCSDYGLVKTGTAQLLTYWNGIKAIIGDFFCSYNTAVTSNITTFNPADKSANITLSGGNLTASITTPNTGSVRSIASVSSGTWIFETTFVSGASPFIGMANASATMAGFLGQDNNSIGWNTGTILKNNVIIANVPAIVAGDVIGVLYDATSNTITFFKNGVLAYQATGANIPSGALYGAAGGSLFTVSMTANFGATAYAYSYSNVISVNLSPTTAGLQFSSQDNGKNAGTDYLMLKNASQAWTLTPSGSPTLITDADYPGISTVSVTGITRSGTTATVTTPANTNFQVGSSVTIAGAVQVDYNGVKTVTGVTASSSTSTIPVPISLFRSGTTVTANSSGPHGYTNGQSITISGAGQEQYNSTFTITWISASSFSFQVVVTGTDVTSPAGGTPIVSGAFDAIFVSNTAGALNTWACIPGSFGLTDILTNGETVTISSNGYFPGGSYVVASVTSGGAFQVTTTGVTQVVTNQNTAAFRVAPTISSITSTGGLTPVGVVTTSAAHGYVTGKFLGINGATPVNYNVNQANIIVLSSTTFSYFLTNTSSPAQIGTGAIKSVVITTVGATFTYTVANAPVTPATGTITASGGRNTVPGIVYLNGKFGVMDVAGVVYTSDIDNPTSWQPLEFVAADNETGAGKALAKSLNYVIAFKEWSTEYLWDAKLPPPGSPWDKVNNGFTLIGCASGASVVSLDNALMWVSQARQEGRSVFSMIGVQQSKVSTPDVERIINADDLATVYAYGLKLDGHTLYVLTLVTSNITLVYDKESQYWYTWTSYTIAASKSVTSITLVGTTATVTTSTPHGLSDGDPVKISGSNQAGYNGIRQTQYVSTTVFTIEVDATTVTPATGTILAFPYTESYFKFTKYADCNGLNLMLHESDGHLYKIQSSLFQDNAIPIDYMIRSQRLDGKSFRKKTMSRITLDGDKVSDTAMVRWSDDDYVTNSPYRIVDLNAQKPMIRRCGSFVDRSIEIKHIGNTNPIWDAIELEVK